MAYTTIDDPSAHFQVTLYTGTGSSQSITNDGNSDMQPDLWWQINRDLGRGIYVADSSRGVTKYLTTFTTNADDTVSTYVTSFDSDGFTLGSGDTAVNNSGQRFVTWNWKANGGTTSSNTDGSITSTVQANTDAGFSIVTFTGDGNNDATIGHGLGTTPAMIITKNRSDSVSWRAWNENLTANHSVFLNSNNGETGPTGQGNGYIKTVNSSTYSVYQGSADTNGVNGSGDDMVAYCFAEKQGFSKFGGYVGVGSSAVGVNPFAFTGFKPAFIMIKSIDTSGSWMIYDHKRLGYNPIDVALRANGSDAESTSLISGDDIHIHSNGFKIITSNNTLNSENDNYFYMAFAETPFVTSGGVPTTAR